MGLTFAKIAAHLLAAVAAGGIIGVERSFHGRPAGFRTHTLVALASSMLMLITLYQGSGSPPRRRSSASIRRAWPRGS